MILKCVWVGGGGEGDDNNIMRMIGRKGGWEGGRGEIDREREREREGGREGREKEGRDRDRDKVSGEGGRER